MTSTHISADDEEYRNYALLRILTKISAFMATSEYRWLAINGVALHARTTFFGHVISVNVYPRMRLAITRLRHALGGLWNVSQIESARRDSRRVSTSLPPSSRNNDSVTTAGLMSGRPIDMRHQLRHREILYNRVPSTVRKVRVVCGPYAGRCKFISAIE